MNKIEPKDLARTLMRNFARSGNIWESSECIRSREEEARLYASYCCLELGDLRHLEYFLEECPYPPYDYYIFCSEVAVQLLKQKRELPKKIRAFLIDMLNGDIKKPSKAKGRFDNRDLEIASAVALLVDVFGINATRNDGTEGLSASDHVAHAYNRSSDVTPIKHKAVQKIWAANKTLAEAFVWSRKTKFDSIKSLVKSLSE